MKRVSTNRAQARIRDAVRRIKVQLLVRGNPNKNISNDAFTMGITPRNLGG